MTESVRIKKTWICCIRYYMYMKKHIKDVETQKPHWKNKNLSWSWHSQLRAKATLSVLQGPCKSEPRHLLNRLNTKSPSDRKASHASTDLGQSATLRSLWKLSEPRKKPLLYKQPGFFSLLIWFQWRKSCWVWKLSGFKGRKSCGVSTCYEVTLS